MGAPKGGNGVKFYRMAIENIKTGERDTYISKRQGAAPAGWKCVGVCGYFEHPARENKEHEQEER